MRYPAAEQLEIIRLVEQSRLPVRRTLDKLGILPASFYRWYDRYQSGGYEALKDRPPRPKQAWNRIPDDVRGRVFRLALDAPALSPRELATRFIDTEGCFVSEASVYRLLKAHDLIASPAFGMIKAADAFKDKTVRPNQLWQTDFTYLKVIGWGWFYLSTILDDCSRYIIAWKLCPTMRTEDVTDTLELALKASGCDQAKVVHKPRLLSDNGSSYLSGDLAEWLDDQSLEHVRGAPYHPQTQGKIERWHQTLKNRILLENYYLPGDLEAQLGVFVEHYNHRRDPESLNNLTPADRFDTSSYSKSAPPEIADNRPKYSEKIGAQGQSRIVVRDHPHRTQKLVSLLEAQPLFEHHRLFLENGLLESSDDGGEFAAAFQVPDQRWAEFVPVVQNPISEQH